MRNNLGFKLVKILIVLAFIGLFFLWYSRDVDLNPEAAQWIQELNQKEAIENNAYLYLLGIEAAETQDPFQIGQEKLDLYLNFLRDNEIYTSEAKEPLVLKIKNQIRLPDKEQFCQFAKIECLETWLQSSLDELESHLNKHQLIYDRYKFYLSIPDSKRLGYPSINDPIPEYSYLKMGNTLSNLKTLLAARKGIKLRHKPLIDEINDLRRRLRQSEQMLTKLVITSMISDSLAILFFLEQRDIVNINEPLDPLNQSELSLASDLQYEFVMQANFYPRLMRTKNLFDGNKEHPPYFNSIVIKPNKTINMLHDYFSNLIKLEKLPPANYFSAYEKIYSDYSNQSIDLKNPVGSTLARVGTFNMQKYKMRIFALDAKIKLFNAYTASKDLGNDTEINHLINPFFPEETVIINDEEICFRTPSEDKNNQACLFKFQSIE